jgi:hypothetical protein
LSGRISQLCRAACLRCHIFYSVVGGVEVVKSKARSAFRKSRRNHWQSKELQRSDRARKLLFETLESRQLLSYVPGEFPNLDAAFQGNYLPQREFRAATAGDFLTGSTAGNPVTIGFNYLAANGGTLGLTPADINTAIVTNSYTSDGITHVYLQQAYQGIPIADANASVHVAANGQVIAADANFVRNLPDPQLNPAAADISAESALSIYANLVGAQLIQPITRETTTAARRRAPAATRAIPAGSSGRRRSPAA